MAKNFIVCVLVLLGGQQTGVLQELPVIPAKEDLKHFYADHKTHGQQWVLARLLPDAEVVLVLECDRDGNTLERRFDDDQTPVWFVSADRAQAIRVHDFVTRPESPESPGFYLAIGWPNADAAIASVVKAGSSGAWNVDATVGVTGVRK
jgi:hypothetical protein